MKFSDFINRLSWANEVCVQIWLYEDDFFNPIAIIQADWKGVEAYKDCKVSEIRFEECNGWTIKLKVILETPIFGQAFNPD